MKSNLFGLLLPFLCAAGATEAQADPTVVLETNKGNIVIQLDQEKAPISTENFLNYVKSGYYDGTIFHRVIKNFMIQGGGFTEDMREKGGQKSPIKNEATNGLQNKRGTIAMARTMDINSATSQFFINLVDNSFLDHGTRDYGYAVFGKVIQGMDVVDQIATVRTGNHGMHQDVPTETIKINKATVK